MDKALREIPTQIRRSNRAAIMRLQEAMCVRTDSKMGDSDMAPLTHHFAPGVYARQIFIPADHTIIGKIHRHAHVNVLMQGRIRVTTEAGQQILEAPKIWVSEPGTKRACYAETDTIWVTIHATDETDLVKIEAEVISPVFLDNLVESN